MDADRFQSPIITFINTIFLTFALLNFDVGTHNRAVENLQASIEVLT